MQHFCGSIQIFKYLLLNNVKLTPSLWIYAIHSNNPDIIHILEENHVNLLNYEECMKEAIKCHHNNLSEYLQNNYSHICDENPNAFFNIGLKYYNFSYIQYDLIKEDTFYMICMFDYYSFVELILKDKSIDMNQKIIS